MIRFHNEILNFTNSLRPTPIELSTRQLVTSHLNLLLSKTHGIKLVLFGSTFTNTTLPNSDLDLTAVFAAPPQQSLADLFEAISRTLVKAGVSDSVEQVLTAKVPVLKFIAYNTLSVDIAFPKPSYHSRAAASSARGFLPATRGAGPPALGVTSISPPFTSEFIRKKVEEIAVFRPLLLVLKIFLKRRNLNDVFFGGITSFALSILILNFLKSQRGRAKAQNIGFESFTLGHLLMDFFVFYAELDVATFRFVGNGDLVRHSGRPNTLSMRSPCDPSIDLGKPIYRWSEIQLVFREAYLSILMDLVNGEISLAAPRLLGSDYKTYFRRLEKIPECLLTTSSPTQLETPLSPTSDVDEVVELEESDTHLVDLTAQKQRKRNSRRRKKSKNQELLNLAAQFKLQQRHPAWSMKGALAANGRKKKSKQAVKKIF